MSIAYLIAELIQTERVKSDNRPNPIHHEILLVQASNQTGVVSSTGYICLMAVLACLSLLSVDYPTLTSQRLVIRQPYHRFH